jgi:iron complex outermembrane receptor protein
MAVAQLISGLRTAGLWMIVMFVCTLSGAFAEGVQLAQQVEMTDIPAQPLGAALERLAKDRRFQIVFVSEDVTSLHSRGASGQLTRDQALNQLLEGTGLTFRYLDDVTVIVAPVLVRSTTDPRAQQLVPKGPAAQRVGRPVSIGVPQQSGNRDPTEEVSVTGTRLHLTLADIASPMTVITQQDIKERGLNTVEDVVASLPQLYSRINAATTLDDTQNAHDTQGLSAADLRGLGPENTLILVNGRRRALSQLSDDIVNLNTIPFGSVERIEIMTDGASAVYGSDAVAGALNFILRKN